MKIQGLLALVLLSPTSISASQYVDTDDVGLLRKTLDLYTLEGEGEAYRFPNKLDLPTTGDRQLFASWDTGSCESGTDPCLNAGIYGAFTAGNESCNGDNACENAGYSGLFVAGNRSCNGQEACVDAGLYGEFTAGEESCNGKKACDHAAMNGTFTAAAGTCIGEKACIGAGEEESGRATIGEGSCNGTLACNHAGMGGEFTVGVGSCSGEDACEFAGSEESGRAAIADGSCNGAEACISAGLKGEFVVGELSCRGENACDEAGSEGGRVSIGDVACYDDAEENYGCSCERAGYKGIFTVEDYSCVGENACQGAGYEGDFFAGVGSCTGIEACGNAAGLEGGIFKVGNGTCNSGQACYSNGRRGIFEAGDNSCLGDWACSSLAHSILDTVKIGNGSCQGYKACERNYLASSSFTIGDNSCNCDECCFRLLSGSIIGDGQCNTLEDECGWQDEPVIRPLPSSSPSTSPSLSTAPSQSPQPSSAPSESLHPSGSFQPSESFRPSQAPYQAASNQPSQIPSKGPVIDLNGNVVGYPAPFTLTSELAKALDYYCDTSNATAVAYVEDIYGPVEEWDTSKVTSFEAIMSANQNSNRATCNPNVSAWNTSSVTSMGMAFKFAASFNQDLSGWDLSNVDFARAMFKGAESFQGTGVDNWDVSKVTDMNQMFFKAYAFDSNVSNWNTAKVINFDRTFRTASSFQGVGLDQWDVSSAVNMDQMFARNYHDPVIPAAALSNWNVANVQTFEGMFRWTNFIGDLCNWKHTMDDKATVTNMFASTNCVDPNDPIYNATLGYYVNVCAAC